MNCDEYNGYTNYETWCVALWIDNEQSTQEWALELARTTETAYDLAALLKDELVEQGMPDLGNCVYSDLLDAALSEVNWYELAIGYREQVAEDAEVTA